MTTRRFSTFRILKASLLSLATIAAAGLLDLGNAAQAGTWCAEAGGRGAYRTCSFNSFRQCLAYTRGLGGTCHPNPASGWRRR